MVNQTIFRLFFHRDNFWTWKCEKRKDKSMKFLLVSESAIWDTPIKNVRVLAKDGTIPLFYVRYR